MQVKNPRSSDAPARPSESGSAAPGASIWSPLQRAVFRSIWIALVALLQTATSLPILLLGLPAGALADVVDQRRLLLVTEAWLLLVALALGVRTLAGTMSDWTLLALIFLMGVGGARDGPAWQAVVSAVVERQDLPAAGALNIVGFNVARAVGPARGGLVVAAAGPGAVFLLNAASFLAVLGVIYRWRHTRAISAAPPEDMLGANLTGMRYVRNAPALQTVLVRAGVFIFGASALWALLPVVARRELGLDATGYGIVLGCLGLGAVAGALLLPRLRRALPLDRLTAAATLVFAGTTLALAYLRFTPLVLVSLETFVVPSWGEHLRQHARVTADDQALEARRDAFLQPGVAPVTAHLIAAHVFDGRPAAEPSGAALPINM